MGEVFEQEGPRRRGPATRRRRAGQLALVLAGLLPVTAATSIAAASRAASAEPVRVVSPTIAYGDLTGRIDGRYRTVTSVPDRAPARRRPSGPARPAPERSHPVQAPPAPSTAHAPAPPAARARAQAPARAPARPVAPAPPPRPPAKPPSRPAPPKPPAPPPLVDIAPDPNFLEVCSSTSVDRSASCQDATLAAIDNARSRQGLPPMALPSDWSSLPGATQLFVLTNLERTARGLPAIPATSASFDAAAMAGAESGNDPSPPPGSGAGAWTSNWAADLGSPLEVMYLWMYDDGPGGPNLECTAAGQPGCWGHRANILFAYSGSCVAGVALAPTGYGGAPAWAELIADIP